VHGFRFSEDVEGFVVTLAAPLINHLQAQLGNSVHALAQAESYPAGKERVPQQSVFSIAGRIQRPSTGAGNAHAFAGQRDHGLGQPSGDQRRNASQRPQRQREYLNGFIQLVEETYRQHVKVEDLAHRLGISVSHLNGTCRELAGQPALQIMHERQLLEAKRLLTYTSMTIYEMSECWGFPIRPTSRACSGAGWGFRQRRFATG
jgi:AraC family transcriptional activator of pobA